MMRIALFATIFLGLALIALLFGASSNNATFADHYTWLFGLGVVLVIGLFILIGYQISVLAAKLQKRVFGSKLALRLMAVFALMAVIPGGLVYAIAVQFLNRSIDSWFDVPIDKALDSALKLGKLALDYQLTDLARRAQAAGTGLAAPVENQADILKNANLQFGFDEIALYRLNGSLVARGGQTISGLTEKPSMEELQKLRDSRYTQVQKMVENLPERGMYLRVVIAIPANAANSEYFALQVIKAVPKEVAADAQWVEIGVRDFQQLAFQRQGLNRLFALTLTLTMLLTLFSAIALSFVISERLSAPLSALAESTMAISKGDFTKLNPVRSRDEFGVLTQSFNTMTRQLAEASDIVARKQHELENAKAYLESILGNLTSGVMAFDERFQLNTANKIAEDLLGYQFREVKGLKLIEWTAVNNAVGQSIRPLVEEIIAQFSAANDKAWECQIEYIRNDSRRMLLVRGTRLPASIDSGYVVVFDDITHLIQAQRDAAWGEVARRLAHEIKNPLTPIQLSAERLQQKLSNKLPAAEADLLARATQTIVAQVGALKGMVDDFSLYSRSARLTLSNVSLNSLISEVLVLYESMGVTIETELSPELPPMQADSALLRQVIHNLIQNSIDALAGIGEPHILVGTHLQPTSIVLTVLDNGSGIGESVAGRVFEPYVTTKPKGTGLGLAIVKKIIDEHHAVITLQNATPHGTLVKIEFGLTDHA